MLQHAMWQAWDFAVDISLSQLPNILERSAQYNASSFFEEQLTAFEVWLKYGGEKRPPPEQVPANNQILSPLYFVFKVSPSHEKIILFIIEIATNCTSSSSKPGTPLACFRLTWPFSGPRTMGCQSRTLSWNFSIRFKAATVIRKRTKVNITILF